jgi:hypothetical protein
MIVTESGIDVTDCTPITVAVDVPVTPKAVAEMVETPRFKAVTCPADETVATPGSELDQEIPVDGRRNPSSDFS